MVLLKVNLETFLLFSYAKEEREACNHVVVLVLVFASACEGWDMNV